jgi:hypothetical protein
MTLQFTRGLSRQCSFRAKVTELLTALEAKPCGAGYKGKCPAHADDSPSLSIKETEGGKILVHCFGGCSQQNVLDALRRMELWPVARSQGGGKA